MGVIFPWPSRLERQAAVADARREKERSRSAAVHAAAIEQDITRLAAVNHFADAIAATLIQDHQDRKGR
jgi:hypothetical protein